VAPTIGSIGFEANGKAVTEVYQNKFTVRAWNVQDTDSGVQSLQFVIKDEDGTSVGTYKAVRENATTWAQYVGVPGPGIYTAEAAATDDSGNISSTASGKITVKQAMTAMDKPEENAGVETIEPSNEPETLPESSTEPEPATEPDDTPRLMGKTTVVQKQAEAYLAQMGIDMMDHYGISNGEFVSLYWQEADREGVDAAVAFAQMLVETNGADFSGNRRAIQNNPGCLLEENGTPYEFASINEGIRAHIQHIKCYACTDSPEGTLCVPGWDEPNRGSLPTMKAWAKGDQEYLLHWETIYRALQQELPMEEISQTEQGDMNETKQIPDEAAAETDSEPEPDRGAA
jgi:hypothetical protein